MLIKKLRMKLIVTMLGLMFCTAIVAHAGDYVIGEGDGLDISVWGIKELNFGVKVRPDGKISVPGLGDLVASGYTPQALQKVLGDKLKDLVKNPIVTVTVREITNSKVYIFGGGVKAGVYDLSRRTSLLQLLCTISETKMADLSKSYLLRGNKKIKENFHKLFVNGDINEDVQLESGDSLFLPLLIDKNVYVLGAVNASKALEYREGLTVIEAIMEAGGFTKFADMNDVQIRRKGSTQDEVIQVKVKKLINGGDLTQNLSLKPGDYIIVKEGLF